MLRQVLLFICNLFFKECSYFQLIIELRKEGGVMLEEILSMFLLDGEMTFVLLALLVISTVFSLFLLYRIPHKIYAGIAAAVVMLTAADGMLCAMADDWDIGFVSMYAGMLLVPMTVSFGLAFFIYKFIRFSVKGKIVSAVLVLAFVAGAYFFWPEPLEEKIGVATPDGVFCYYDGETFTEKRVADNKQLKLVLSQINCTPCIFTPSFSEDCIVIRLNQDYVLLTERYKASYIFEYSGDIESFEPGNACFRVYRNKPLYISIKTS